MSNSVPAPAAEPAAAPTGRGRLWQGLLGIAISVGFLVWALWGEDLGDVAARIRQANPWWFALSVVTVTLSFPLRTIRWRILLHSSMGEVPFAPVWRATAIGFMANNVLPARAGEIVRSYAADRLVGVPFATALASVAVERVFDGVIIVLLLAIGAASPSFPAGATLGSTGLEALAYSMAALFVGALVVLIVLVRSQHRALPLVERIVWRILPARFGEKAVRILHNLVAGMGVLHSVRDVARVILWSVVVWLINAVSFWAAFKAFRVDVPASAALVLQGVVAFGVAIPSAPGFFGVFEKLSQLVLGLYGVPGGEAASFAIGTHMGWFLPITLIGLVILARTGLSLKDLRSGDAPGSPARRP